MITTETPQQLRARKQKPTLHNPILATRIWGGPFAEDLWGIYNNDDNEAPLVPENLSASNARNIFY